MNIESNTGEIDQTTISNTSENIEMFSHDMFMDTLRKNLNELIKNEPLLFDIETDFKNAELKEILSLERGESMTLFIRRADGQLINLIVNIAGTVNDLKTALESFYKSRKARQNFPDTTSIINWKHTWKNYSLVYDNEKLLDPNKALRDYGIVNRCELEFARNVFRRKT